LTEKLIVPNILITGKPGVGKTTLIKKIVMKLQSRMFISGFWTIEVRKNGKRIGFDIQTTEGKQGILARQNNSFLKSSLRVGKYSVNLSDLEEIALPTLYKSADLVVIDEIGKMELLSSKFKDAVEFAFNNQPKVLATIARYRNRFLTSIEERSNVQLIELTKQNRGKLLEEILSKLSN
jgi:nucleoside-triphosphatase